LITKKSIKKSLGLNKKGTGGFTTKRFKAVI